MTSIENIMGLYLGKDVADKYIRYCCNECSELHEDKWDAEQCCTPIVSAVLVCPSCEEMHASIENALACESKCTGSASVGARTCPVCHEFFKTVDQAVDCCLWKTMDFGARYRMARERECAPDIDYHMSISGPLSHGNMALLL